ncbi:MAG: aliphatic sulfonate ABC transporter substrate-binding protein [Polyangiales bacterium]
MSRRFKGWLFALAIVAACTRGASEDKPKVVRLDYATYNPLSLLLKERRYLEDALKGEGVEVEWVKSLGSNKALELLHGGSIDFGSTAGAAALLSRANGNPIRAIYVYSKPEWTALVTRMDTGIRSISDLKGKKVAVTRGTDPFVFLVRALDSVGLGERDVEIVPLQHPDGKAALERGDVDAWAGLDPLMATSELERGSVLFHRAPDWNTYGVLDVREEFAGKHPSLVDKVLRAYERARAAAKAEPDALRAALVKEANISDTVAKAVLARTDLSAPKLGAPQRSAILAAGDVLKKSGVVGADTDVRAVGESLLEPKFADAL